MNWSPNSKATNNSVIDQFRETSQTRNLRKKDVKETEDTWVRVLNTANWILILNQTRIGIMF